MSAYAPLLEELDRWQQAGRIADLWLRDDDAVEPSAALDQLLERSASAQIPLVVAAIPMLATKNLARRLAAEPAVTVWQHGITHTNNASDGMKKQELTAASPEILQGLQDGWRRLGDIFPTQAGPVLVPPWNRIAPDLIRHLPEVGITGLSTYHPREHALAAVSVWQANTHVDVINWKQGREFVGQSRVSNEIAAHLAARRAGMVDAEEPTGILTHHLVMEDCAWAFLSDLFALTNSHPAARWCVPHRELQ